MAEPAKTPEVHVLLSMDMHDADPAQRRQFDIALREKKWRKVKGADTTWYAKFIEGGTPAQAKAVTKQDIDEAAASCEPEIESYEGVILASFEPLDRFNKAAPPPILKS